MTGPRRLELTDELIERMILERSGSRPPADLVVSIVSAAATTAQWHGRVIPAFPRRAASRSNWLVVGVIFALLMLGAALLVGSFLLQERSVPTALYSSWTSVGSRAMPYRNGNHTIITNNRVDMTFGPAGIQLPWVNADPADLFSTASLEAPNTLAVRASASWPTWDCSPGIEGRYTFGLSPDGSTLTLTPLADGCPTRSTALKGEWTRTEMGDLTPGRHVSALFKPFNSSTGQFFYTVPTGWTDGWEAADVFSMAATSDTTGSMINLYSNPLPWAQSGEKCAVSIAGNEPTPAEVAAWLATLPGLVTTTPTPVTIGGLVGVTVDVSVSPGWRDACSGPQGEPFRDTFTESLDGSPVGLTGDARARYIILDTGQGQFVLIDLEAPDKATWDALVTDAMPIVDTFEFDR